jgi:hypothetical protein
MFKFTWHAGPTIGSLGLPIANGEPQSAPLASPTIQVRDADVHTQVGDHCKPSRSDV